MKDNKRNINNGEELLNLCLCEESLGRNRIGKSGLKVYCIGEIEKNI